MEGVCRQAVSEFSLDIFDNPRKRKFSPNRVDSNYTTNYSTAETVKKALIAAARTLQSDINFRIFFHRGHNYTRDRMKKEWIIWNANIMARCCEPIFFLYEWRGSETGKDKYTGAIYEFVLVGVRGRRPRNGREWNRPIIRILIPSDTINQRNASGFYPHSLFRSSLYDPPKRTARGLILVPLKRHSYSVCLVCVR